MLNRRDFLRSGSVVVPFLAATARSQAAPQSLLPRAYKVVRHENVPMQTRDGLTLLADIHRPDAPGRFPVILMRTPYNKATGSMGRDRLVSRGYVLVIQDCRSRYMSEGDWYHPMVHEALDGYDAVEWVAQLPWSNGRVGTAGQSAVGMTQYLLASAAPPHLRTSFVVSSAANFHDTWVYRSAGVLDFAWLIPYLLRQVSNQVARRGVPHLMTEVYKYASSPALWTLKSEEYLHTPIYDWVARLKDLAPYIKDYLDHPAYDGYWQHIDVERHAARITVPMYHLTSWYDGFLDGSLDMFAKARKEAASDAARSGQRLLIGPWIHTLYWRPASTAGDVDFGAEAMIRTEDIEERWFDYWLKDVDSGIASQRPIQLFVMGDNIWRDEDEWPLARTKWTPYYLHSDGHANSLEGDGRLSPAKPDAETTDSFVYDPAAPVPTRGGSILDTEHSRDIGNGPQDQRPIEHRRDVLVYTSDSLARALEVTGPLIVRLFAASTAPDTDFTAKLVDVRPDGYAQNLQNGIVRARFRASRERAELITPGQIYEYTIDLWATSHVFKPGHRIRVEISSSNFPQYDRNHNTGGPLFKEAEFRTATQTVFHDAARPSHIVLPVVPR